MGSFYPSSHYGSIESFKSFLGFRCSGPQHLEIGSSQTCQEPDLAYCDVFLANNTFWLCLLVFFVGLIVLSLRNLRFAGGDDVIIQYVQ